MRASLQAAAGPTGGYCLLFRHYLSGMWARGGEETPRLFCEQIVLTGCSLVYDTGHQSIHLIQTSFSCFVNTALHSTFV